jgi:hypothetical protein
MTASVLSVSFLSDQDVLIFYGWWQLSVCLFAFCALIAVWRHIGKKQHDFGQVWLALSVLCWSISGAFEVYFAHHSEVNSFIIEGWRSIWSLSNSLFILLALPWFRYLPKPLEPVIKSKYWMYIVGLPFLFSFLPTVSKMVSGKTLAIISELDVYYAVLTLIFLCAVLWESFVKRRLKALAWLSIICIVVTLIAQFYKLSGSSINLTLFSAIFKTSLIMIFFALALSWVKELSENILPEIEYLKLQFLKEKNEQGKLEQVVFISGLPGTDKRKVLLTPALFDLFFIFASRKKAGTNEWLEIKPKSPVGSEKNYDIKDYNELKRLLAALLDGLFGKGNWTQEQHAKPLKSLLFEMSENRERKIRLRIPKENLHL